MDKRTIRVLVVEDNPEDYQIIQRHFSKIPNQVYRLDNAANLTQAVEKLGQGQYDVYLVDYQLGPDSGMELLREAALVKCPAPIILLTGHADTELDMRAMSLGAADFLNKNKLEPELLERAIRYSLENKRSQEALRREEEFFRALIENAQDGISILKADRIVEYVSPAIRNILGHDPQKVKENGGVIHYAHPEDQASIKDMLTYLFGSLGRVQTLEIRAKHEDGTWRNLELTAKSYQFPHIPQPVVVFNYRDVTESKKAERAISRLATIVESSEDAIYSVTLEGVILSWNPGAERIYGYSAQEAGGRSLELITVPSREGEFLRLLETVRDGKAVANFMTRHQSKNGNQFPLSLTVSPIKNPIGQVVNASIVARDVSESERSKNIQADLLQERENLLERLRLYLEKMPMAFILTDEQFNHTYWNPAAERMFGYKFLEVEGRKGMLVSSKDWEEKAPELQQKAKSGEGFQGRIQDIVRKDGTVITCEWYGTPLKDDEGKFSGMMSMAIDVTEKKKAQEVQAQLAVILQQSPDAIIGLDLEGKIFSWNPGAEKMYGYSLEEIVGRSIEIFLPEDRKREIREIMEIVLQDKVVPNFETVRLKKNGEPIDVSLTVFPVKDGTGRIVGVSGILRDITEKKKAEESFRKHEEQMRLVEKMNAIGRLAGGVAHDFNNLLSVIGGNAEFLLSSLEKDNEHRDEVEEIQKAVRRGSDLTKQLLVFGRKQVSQPQPVNLNEMSAELNKMLKRLLDAHVELSIIQEPSLKPILADPGQMQQVLMNLVLNARDAMPKGGSLIIETRNMEAPDIDPLRMPSVPPAPYVRLSVTDTGEGMTPEVQKRIFEPFFTTKAGKGTGLGLASVYGIVQQWKGHILVHSSLGMGTTFSLYFPVMENAEIETPKVKQISLIPQGSETILVAEDEDPVRKVLVRTLKQYGYQVLEAPNGLEALQTAWTYKDTIHLLLTDTVMPKMNGKELADEIHKTRPKLKVVFVSGYPKEILSQQGILEPGITLIQKPFELDELVRQMRKVLDEK